MTRVKICGITTVEDGLAAAEAGADFVGLILYPPSPRSVTAEEAASIAQKVRQASAVTRTVGVFVDRDVNQVAQIAERCGLDAVQLHGREPPEDVDALMKKGLMVFKAFRVRDSDSLEALGRYGPSAYLLDAYVREQHGGTGQRFDWSLATAAKAHGPILLAGGVTPGNVAQAVERIQPWGVDTASGVEVGPGRKDHEEVRRFVRAVRHADTRWMQTATGEGNEHDG